MIVRLVLIGPPGSGKGTQAVLVQERYKVPQISTGDILRAAIRDGTPLGKQAQIYMDKGNLVPDEIIVDMMKERLEKDDCQNGYILDGFPRTLKQAEALDEMLEGTEQKLDMVLSIEVPDDEVIVRLAGRRQCKNCGEGYHMKFRKPSMENICDKCGGELYIRDDDKEETVKARLNVYRRQTAPLLNYYDRASLLRKVDGRGNIDGIFKEISSLINRVSLTSAV